MELSSLNIGAPLPNWHLEAFKSAPIPSIADFRGAPLLILFFSLDCPGCLGRAIPYANRVLYENGETIRVLGIHVNLSTNNTTAAAMEAAKEEFYIRFPVYKDMAPLTTFRAYGAGGTPHWVLVDKDGQVLYSLFGSDPNNALLRLDYRINEAILS